MSLIYTVGHSTRSAEEFLTLLQREGIRKVYDIRAFPGSRRFPHFGRDELASRLAEHDIAYEHLPGLGGRRRAPPDAPPTAWRNDGFKAYAAYMTTTEFQAALAYLITAADAAPSAIMCSEAMPWRCHRTMVSDALVARDVEVRHILDGKLWPHAITEFAVVRGAEVSYPPAGSAGQTELGLDRG